MNQRDKKKETNCRLTLAHAAMVTSSTKNTRSELAGISPPPDNSDPREASDSRSTL